MHGINSITLFASLSLFLCKESLASELSISQSCMNTFGEVQEQAYGFNSKSINSNGVNFKGTHPTRPILRLSCNKVERWENLTFPEQFEMTGSPYLSVHSYGRCYSSVDELREAISDHVDDWEKDPIGSFSTTTTANESPQNLTIPASARCLAQFTRYRTRFEGRIKLNSPRDRILDRAFLQAYKDLPEKYEENPSPYQEFIETFGTHYWQRGYYGNAYHVYVLSATPLKNQGNAVESALDSFKEFNPLGTNEELAYWIQKIVDEEYRTIQVGSASYSAGDTSTVPMESIVVAVRSSSQSGDPWQSKNSNQFLGGWSLELTLLLNDYKQRVKIESLGKAIKDYLKG